MLKKILLISFLEILLVSCATHEEPKHKSLAESSTLDITTSSAPVTAEPKQAMTLISNHNSIYFGFDQYNIEDSYKNLIKANADYLVANSNSKVQVQGNTDDIGSVEYNLALGQKRAEIVEQALVADGVNKDQIEAISYGKLKPKYQNDSDASRALNRRTDIIFKVKEPKGYGIDSMGLPIVDGTFYSGTLTEGVQ